MLCCLSNVNRCLRRTVEGRNCYRSSRFLLPKYTNNMRLLFSRACFRVEWIHESVSLSIYLHEARLSLCNEVIQLRTSRLSSLITSCELLNGKVQRVWSSLSGTIGRASHSLFSHTKGVTSTREVKGQQRLVHFC